VLQSVTKLPGMNLPTEPGWHWYRMSTKHTWVMVDVVNAKDHGLMNYNQGKMIPLLDGYYVGPVEPPAE
jgi:hypothetical protein